jgi:hypothetical protein
MSWLSSGVKKVRKALHLPPITLKNVATKYAPVALGVGATMGLGPLAGIASKAGSLASSLPGASKIASGVGAVRKVLNTGEAAVPQVMRNGSPISISDINPNIGAPSSSPSGGGGGGMDWLGLAEGGLAGLQAYNSAKASGRAGKYQQQALDQANARYAEGAPLRAMGRARILNPQRPDLTSVYNDPTNAFSAPATTAPAAPVSTAPALPRRRLLPIRGG